MCKHVNIRAWTGLLSSEVPGAHFNNDFFIVIQILWRFHSALIHAVVKWLLWNFAHGTTAVQQYDTIQWSYTKNKFPLNWRLRWKNRSWNGPQVLPLSNLDQFHPGKRSVDSRAPSQYKNGLSRYGISIIMIRWSWESLIFIMGVPILVRWHLYIVMASWAFSNCSLIHGLRQIQFDTSPFL